MNLIIILDSSKNQSMGSGTICVVLTIPNMRKCSFSFLLQCRSHNLSKYDHASCDRALEGQMSTVEGQEELLSSVRQLQCLHLKLLYTVQATLVSDADRIYKDGMSKNILDIRNDVQSYKCQTKLTPTIQLDNDHVSARYMHSNSCENVHDNICVNV